MIDQQTARCFLVLAAGAAVTLGGCASTEPQAENQDPVVMPAQDPAPNPKLARSGEALRIYADAAMKNAMPQEAVTYLREVVRREPTSVTDVIALGRAYLGAGRASSAREQFIIARELEPTNMKALEGLADALLGNGQYAELYRVLEDQASKTNRVSDHARIARYAELLGDVDRAEQSLIVAARLDRGQTAARQIALADLYRRVGNRDKELYRLRTSLFLAPENEDLFARIRALGEIPGPTAKIRPPERPRPEGI